MLDPITYAVVNPHRRNAHIAVYLAGKRVGTIKQERASKGGRWYYTPKGIKESGNRFLTLDACKHSLESVS